MKTVGIIGGMGPLATVDLLNKIIALTDAKKDQEHVHVIADIDTDIPDRSAAIINGGENPLPFMIRSANRLINAGAQILCMACNTAHYFYDGVAASVDTPIIHMPIETAKEAKKLGYTKIGLMSTVATIQTGIYEEALKKEGLELVIPSKNYQQEVMDVIFKGVKANCLNYPSKGIKKALEAFSSQGVECVILGCTELPLYFQMHNLWDKTLDPTAVLAKRLIQQAGGRVK